jgi:hypothetical protein
MQSFLLAAVLLMSSATLFSAEAGCNLRGEFCSYPNWASNAFAPPTARISEALLPPDRPDAAYGAPYRVKKIRRHR